LDAEYFWSGWKNTMIFEIFWFWNAKVFGRHKPCSFENHGFAKTSLFVF
jgi:hypothetical protein